MYINTEEIREWDELIKDVYSEEYKRICDDMEQNQSLIYEEQD